MPYLGFRYHHTFIVKKPGAKAGCFVLMGRVRRPKIAAWWAKGGQGGQGLIDLLRD
jgi:hypothetical protein